MYFFPLRLEGKFHFFEKMFKLIIVSNTLIILILELFVESFQLLDDLLLVCIFFLKRDDIFIHVERFDFKRSFVFEALIDIFLLL